MKKLRMMVMGILLGGFMVSPVMAAGGKGTVPQKGNGAESAVSETQQDIVSLREFFRARRDHGLNLRAQTIRKAQMTEPAAPEATEK